MAPTCDLDLTVRAIYGPPRPVIVLEVTGEIDRRNQHAVAARVRGEVGNLADPDHCRRHHGATRLSSAIVVDLSRVSFCSASALQALARCRDGAGAPLRLIVPRNSGTRRALVHLQLARAFELFDDLPDATLAGLRVTE